MKAPNPYVFLGHLALVLWIIAPLTLASEARLLRNDDIISLAKAGMPESTILLAVEKSDASFDLSPQALIALKDAGVSSKKQSIAS